MDKPNVAGFVKKINSSAKIKSALTVCSHFATGFSVVVFCFVFWHLWGESFTLFLGGVVCLGVPFVFVTLLRRMINAPRPYEIYVFLENVSKKKKGESFPSRHCFSIFAIGTLCTFVFPILGIVTLVIGVFLCFCRVALGCHFVRDVFSGALVGTVSSLIGGFILL